MNAKGTWTGDTLPFLPFESPQSSILKFGWANALTTKEAAAVFSTAVKGDTASKELNLPAKWAKWVDAYRNTTDIFSRRVICSCLGCDDWLLFETNVLRFCPICLGAGYHTWWHQCHLHTVCLMHGCRLSDQCMVCGTKIFFQNEARVSMREPYICSECSHPVAGVEPTWDAMIDLQAIRPLLMARYFPWAAWFNKLVESRVKWDKLHPVWYGEVAHPRLIRRRAARERQAILSLCPPPIKATISALKIAQVEIIELWRWDEFTHPSCGPAKYDPFDVSVEFMSAIRATFGATALIQFRYCQANILNGYRYHEGDLRVEPLALWIVLLYVEFCAECAGQSGRRKTVADWVMNLVSRATQMRMCVDAGGLLQLLNTLYCEVVDWLSRRSSRECFDLEVSKICVMPGVSAYRIVHGRDNMSSLALIRPSVPVTTSAGAIFDQFSPRAEWNNAGVALDLERYCRPHSCWYPIGGCRHRNFDRVLGWPSREEALAMLKERKDALGQ